MASENKIPKISVVMAIYNSERYLSDAIKSILSQTFSDFEFIIVNDGSTDNSLKIIESFSDPRIKIINQENQGLAKSLNNGLRQARGEFIARMDADDISFPERFEKQIKFFENNPEYDFCGTSAIFINEIRQKIGERIVLDDWQKIKKTILWKNPFIHPSMMFRRTLLDKAGFYYEHPRHSKFDYYPEDYELWLRAIGRGMKCANLIEPLIYYRINPKGLTYGKTRTSLLKNNFQIQWKAIAEYGFPKWQIIYLAKTLTSLILNFVFSF